ncbi:hypothetical protein, partial [Klebsiella pneumoniae]|uniref:hypothetical protein n=1 Tax=Klebsiella pneumoniae TaxID=573 RepID=UPI003C6D338E
MLRPYQLRFIGVSQIPQASFFKDLGGNLGVLAGLTYEVSPPWVVLLICSIMNFFGFFMMWLSVTDRVSKPHVWQMCLYMWIG